MFDVVVMVDWSAASVPKRGKDSIWAATLDRHTGALEVVNHPTRRQAYDALRSRFRSTPGRILAGFDFPFGYPRGFAAAVGLDGWRDVWRELTRIIEDDERNRNNRFEVAAELNRRLGRPEFWGCPTRRATDHLSMYKPAHVLPELRETEAALRRAGTRPFSVWQACYAGSVGSQALTGIPILERLATELADRVEVWPFTTGFAEPPGDDTIVLAEIWPGAIAVDLDAHPVKDAAQVIALCHAADAFDFAPDLPTDVAAIAIAEEGWVLA